MSAAMSGRSASLLVAHEVLMSAPSSAASSRRATPDYDRASQSPDWDWTRRSPFSDPDHDLHNHNGPSETEGGGNETIRDGENADSAQRPTESARPGGNSPEELRTVDVELIWLRLGPECPENAPFGGSGVDNTLSVCLLISWPNLVLVDRAAEFDSTGEVLKALIGILESCREKEQVLVGRSAIEDGQFLGWLTYVDVLTAAEDALLQLREAIEAHGLMIRLHTRDERVLFDANRGR